MPPAGSLLVRVRTRCVRRTAAIVGFFGRKISATSISALGRVASRAGRFSRTPRSCDPRGSRRCRREGQSARSPDRTGDVGGWRSIRGVPPAADAGRTRSRCSLPADEEVVDSWRMIRARRRSVQLFDEERRGTRRPGAARRDSARRGWRLPASCRRPRGQEEDQSGISACRPGFGLREVRGAVAASPHAGPTRPARTGFPLRLVPRFPGLMVSPREHGRGHPAALLRDLP